MLVKASLIRNSNLIWKSHIPCTLLSGSEDLLIISQSVRIETHIISTIEKPSL